MEEKENPAIDRKMHSKQIYKILYSDRVKHNTNCELKAGPCCQVNKIISSYMYIPLYYNSKLYMYGIVYDIPLPLPNILQFPGPGMGGRERGRERGGGVWERGGGGGEKG